MTRRTILQNFNVAGVLLLLGWLVACSGDESLPEQTGMARLCLQVETAGVVHTKGFGGDKHAMEGEFIHSLCVFLVDNQNKIQHKWELKDGKATGEAANGNVTNWTSSPTEHPAGSYTLYAFANWETADDEKWNNIINKQSEDNLTAEDLKLIVNDPASKIDFKQSHYIPMSGVSKSVQLAANQTKNAKVELVRLLGKVEVTIINNKKEEMNISGFTMKPFAGKVALMEENRFEDLNSDTYFLKSFESLVLSFGEKKSFSFYVNETFSPTMFEVSLQTVKDNYSGRVPQPVAIDRNHILPIKLNLADEGYQLSVEAEIAPIGGLPKTVTVFGPQSVQTVQTYDVQVPEGCRFQVKETEFTSDATTSSFCQLSVSGDENNNVEIMDDKMWACVTALSEQTVIIEAVAADNRTYILNVTTNKLENYVTKSTARTFMPFRYQWGEIPWGYESINLIMDK